MTKTKGRTWGSPKGDRPKNTTDGRKVIMLSKINLQDSEFHFISGHIHQNFGIDLTQKKDFIYNRLVNHIIGSEHPNFQSFFEDAVADPDTMALILNRLTTNHTYFYRESDQFNYLTSQLLPTLMTETSKREMRFWSAGCSSGEEPYTLAIELDQFFNQYPGWTYKILATDLSETVLEQAQNGIYEREALEGVPPAALSKYFMEISTDQFLIQESLKSKITFRRFNLCDNFPFENQFSAIFCRNVMIYFDAETKTSLQQKFFNITTPGGFFIAGLIGNLENQGQPFQYIKPGIYTKPK